MAINKKSGLPANLYKNGKSFLYIHPKTKTRHSISLPKAEAIEAANEMNAELMPAGSRKDVLVKKILGGGHGS